MIILGLVLLIIGLFVAKILVIIGIIVLVVGAALAISGSVGREIGGRRFEMRAICPSFQTRTPARSILPQ